MRLLRYVKHMHNVICRAEILADSAVQKKKQRMIVPVVGMPVAVLVIATVQMPAVMPRDIKKQYMVLGPRTFQKKLVICALEPAAYRGKK